MRKIINIGDVVNYIDTWSERPLNLKGKYIRHGVVCEIYPYHVVVKTQCGYKVSVSKVDLDMIDRYMKSVEV